MRPNTRFLGGFAIAAVAAGLFNRPGNLPAGSPAANESTDRRVIGELLKRQGYRAIPLEKKPNSNFLWLKVGLAGQNSQFFVDSGATTTTVDVEVARRLKLPLAATNATGASMGGIDAATLASAWPTLDLGGVAAPLPLLIAMDLQHVNKAMELTGASRVDGILGGDVLNLLSAVIDYSVPVLYVLEPTTALKEIQGEWRGIGVEHNGNTYAADHANKYRFVFDGINLRWAFDGKDIEYRISVDPLAKPKTMAWYKRDGSSTWAIYEVFGDKIRVAVPTYSGDNWAKRPATFTPPKSNGFAVITLERVPNK